MRPRNASTIPPRDSSFVEWLRYLVQSSDPSAGELPLLVQAFAMALTPEGLSDEIKRLVDPFLGEASAWLAQQEALARAPAISVVDMTNVVHLRPLEAMAGLDGATD